MLLTLLYHEFLRLVRTGRLYGLILIGMLVGLLPFLLAIFPAVQHHIAPNWNMHNLLVNPPNSQNALRYYQIALLCLPVGAILIAVDLIHPALGGRNIPAYLAKPISRQEICITKALICSLLCLLAQTICATIFYGLTSNLLGEILLFGFVVINFSTYLMCLFSITITSLIILKFGQTRWASTAILTFYPTMLAATTLPTLGNYLPGGMTWSSWNLIYGYQPKGIMASSLITLILTLCLAHRSYRLFKLQGPWATGKGRTSK